MAAPRRPILIDRLAVSLLLLAVATAAVACAASPSPAATTAANVLFALPQPPSATMVVGSGGPGADGDSRFIAYTSEASPAAERANYDVALRAAGYTAISTSGDWTAYQRAGMTVWISVTANGPQTSIIALVGADPRSTDAPPAVTANPTPTLALGDVRTPHPETPGPRTLPSHGPPPSGSPPPTTAPTPSPSPSPEPSHGKPSDKPTHPPKASPRPTPSTTPKPTHKPKPTPKPKPSHGAGNGGA